MKVSNSNLVKNFKDIPNVGPRMTDDFISLGIKNPSGLKGKDPFKLYKAMCKKTNSRQDPCVLDTYMAVIDFMNGSPAKPWWKYTKERKIKYPGI